MSGTATALDGTTAPYTTRIVVTRPKEQKRFNGSVMLDWTNVTAQFENAVDTLEAREMLLREGWAYVHVSAQAAGLCCTPLTPKVYDPVRYAAINHPGDAYAADMFSQVAQAIRTRRWLARPDERPGRAQRHRRRAVAVGEQALRLRERRAGRGRRDRRLPDPRRRTEDVRGTAPGAGAAPARRPRGQPQPADGRPQLPALGGRGDGALRLLHRLPVGPRQRAAGRRPAGRQSGALPRDHRRSRQLRPDPRPSARRVHGRRVRDADALRGVHGAAPAQPVGPHRHGTGGDTALRVRRQRAGQGPARQHPRRDPDASGRRAGRTLREHQLQPRRHHASRSPTRRSRRSTPRSTATRP